MKNPESQAERWLKQAGHDLQVARENLQLQFYSDCCFMCEQTAQKAMKAFLFAQGLRSIVEHSIAGLVKRAMSYDRAFESLLEQAGVLDQYYIPTRYPDALAEPAVPFETYTSEQASQALKIAQGFMEFVRRKLG